MAVFSPIYNGGWLILTLGHNTWIPESYRGQIFIFLNLVFVSRVFLADSK